ncbi:MAG: hypothetical protein KGO92_06865, partial [Bacteroidota bacterium]|nr:hypothetical protein [Bacteroidota bacterium]
PLFDKILQKFEKYFVQNNMIIVYPQQQPSNVHLDPYDDFTSEPLAKSIETIEQIGKSLSTLFKKT